MTAERLVAAHSLVLAGKHDEARQVLSAIDTTRDRRVGEAVACLRVLVGDGDGALNIFARLGGASTDAGRLARGVALRAAGRRVEAVLEIDATLGRIDLTVEDYFGDLEHVAVPQNRRSSLNEVPFHADLARGDLAAARDAIVAGADGLPEFVPGTPRLRTRGGCVPRWNGEHVKRLAVVLAGGAGDVWLFGRYLPLFRAYCDKLTIAVADGTEATVRRHVDAELVVPLSRIGEALQGADAYAPAWWAWTISRTPGDAVWITPSRSWPLDPDRFHIGLHRRGSAANPNDIHRAASWEALRAFTRPGDVLHSLQIDEPAPPWAIDHRHELRCWEDTAALVGSLDLVVAVDSSVASLAGAMGVPLTVVVGEVFEFRWGAAGTSTAWFPHATVRRRSSGAS
jgi:hypothetical protein